jgi:hypothetical protein
MINLTQEQIKNWRKILSITLGPFALIMPESDIQKIANNLQDKLNNVEDFDEQTKH